ncbi:Fic family protein [Acidithiobacillus ferridurans]|uniref:Fic family protein n=1 Tax=Acidithiobacillus ferridurans TaxID=1232575 RepID=UPI001C076DAA|nr:Fic family protein [Acidithiobacillus ferridurans]MBU2804474.1 Fic family protein [Acidithiobacillus ferridurans]
MFREATGHRETSTAGGETVRSFVPNPLPPVPPLELTGVRQAVLERATLALGRLDSLALLLPDPQLFLYAYVRREAVLSSQIEGTQSSLSDLLLFELEETPGVPFDDVVEVSNYVAALEFGMNRLREGFPLCNRLLRDMHVRLMARGRGAEKAPGEFRRTQNWIGGTRPGNARFVPPPPQEVESCMAALERFIHDDSATLPVLLKAALVHVQFETIHPFLDGNGRLGRLLIAMVLHEGGALTQPLLYLSLYFKQHRDMYYELLDGVRSHGDWEAWVDFFLEGVELTATGAVNTARRLVDLFQQDSHRVQASGRGAANLLRVLEALRQRPVNDLGQISRQAGVSFPTASKAMLALVEMGIARELTGQRRNRVFVYDAYINILNEGGEAI